MQQLLSNLISTNLKFNFSNLNETPYTHGCSWIKGENTYELKDKFVEQVGNYFKTRINSFVTLENEKFSVAGGSVLAMILFNNPFLIRDIDIFPNSEKDFLSLRKKLEQKFLPQEIYESGNSVCFGSSFSGTKIDLIKKYSTDTIACLSNFDLSPTKMGFDQDWNFYINPGSCYNFNKFLTKLFNLKMTIEQKITPDNCLKIFKRVMKYSSKGFVLDVKSTARLFAVIKSNEEETNITFVVQKPSKFADVFDEVIKTVNVSEY